MSRLVNSIFGGGEQEKLLKRQQRDQAAVEAGQQRLREGGRGLLSFIDEELNSSLGGFVRKRGGLASALGG